jgi:hypothetical protein
MVEIKITIKELEDLLIEQKKVVADYITRNLSTYHWSRKESELDIDKAKEELRNEVYNAKYPNEFNVLNKYLGK